MGFEHATAAVAAPTFRPAPKAALQRAAVRPAPVAQVPGIVPEVLESPGHPLDSDTRAEMETGFGRDFSRVRVHTDGPAAHSAAAVQARAYTAGDHIVFGAGHYAPRTPAGQRLVAHELAHVSQQAGAPQPEALQLAESTGPAEAEAALAGQRVAAHQPAPRILPRPEARLQRAPDEPQAEPETLGTIGDAFVDAVASQIAGEGFSKALLAAAIRGFVIELKAQIAAKQQDKALIARLQQMLTLSGALRLFGGYLGGMVAGIISPLTGLFDLAVLGEQLNNLATKLLTGLITGGSHLGDMARGLGRDLVAWGHKALESIRTINVRDVVALLSGMPGKNNELVKKAGEAGHGAARGAVASFVESTTDKPEESWSDIFTKRKEGESVSQPLGLVNSVIERSKEKTFSSLPAHIGYDIGYAIGFLAINIVLFAFTDGLGNLITEMGTWLGKIAPALTRVAEVVKVIGSAIAAVEEAIAAVTKLVFKPLEGVLKEFEPLLVRLKAFLQELFGAAKSEAGTVTELAGKGLASDVTTKKPPVTLAEPKKPPVVNVGETHAPPVKTAAVHSENLGEGALADPIKNTGQTAPKVGQGENANVAPTQKGGPGSGGAPPPDDSGGLAGATADSPARLPGATGTRHLPREFKMPDYNRSSFPSTSEQIGTAEQRAAGRVRTRGEPVGPGEVGTKATSVPAGRTGLRDHWAQHGHEFPEFRSARQYQEGAIDFCRDSSTRRFYYRHQGRPTIGYYNVETNTFAATSVDGETIYTFFRPGGDIEDFVATIRLRGVAPGVTPRHSVPLRQD